MNKNSFRCPLNTPVLTNRQVLNQTMPITIAIHELDDGSWKFFSREEKMNSHEQPIMVSLEEILMIDPSIAEVAHLPEGSIASRRFIGDNWKVVSGKAHRTNVETHKNNL